MMSWTRSMFDLVKEFPLMLMVLCTNECNKEIGSIKEFHEL